MSMSTEGMAVEDWICGVCREVLSCPKILPCLHTFCLPCLQQLADQQHAQRPNFPCPSCGEDTQVPTAGVSAFKDNVYLDSDLLSKARQGLLCLRHREREVELFCLDCDKCLCIVCKLEEHVKHDTQSFEKVEPQLQARLSEDKKRIDRTAEKLLLSIQEVEREIQAVKSKQDLLAEDIHRRHEMLASAGIRLCERALSSLETVTADQEMALSNLILTSSKILEEIDKQQRKAEVSRTLTTAPELLKIASDLKDGLGSERALHGFLRLDRKSISIPVYLHKETLDLVVPIAKDFVGKVQKVNRRLDKTDLQLKFRLNCDERLQIYSLCAHSKGGVSVSFLPSAFSQSTVSIHKYSKDGTKMTSFYPALDARGRPVPTSCKCLQGTLLRSEPNTLYAKSNRMFLLQQEPSGATKIKKIIVSQEQPFFVCYEPFFAIVCGNVHACDVSQNEQWLAVVEEAVLPEVRNKLKIFKCPIGAESSADLLDESPPEKSEKKPAFRTFIFFKRNKSPAKSAADAPAKSVSVADLAPVEACHVYQPADDFAALFQPTDVCFYEMYGVEVLLVADQMDAVHVLQVLDNRLQFLQFLCVDDPFLVQPTALNLDRKGRPLVACRGGTILVGKTAVDAESSRA